MFFPFFVSFQLTWDYYVIFMQITQEVYVVEEWVKEARNDVKKKVHLCLETKKALGAAKE